VGAYIYSPLSGVTTNQSESFNTLLKHYGHWKEAPLDSMIFGLYQLQVYFYNEIQRGYSRLGSYSLSPDYSFAAVPIDELVTLSASSPADIVAKIRSSQESIYGSGKIKKSMKLDSDSAETGIKEDKTSDKENNDIEISKTTSHSVDASEGSQHSRAKYG